MGDNCFCCKYLRLKEKTIPGVSTAVFWVERAYGALLFRL